ncbi:unnamed protein product [Parascedosporium putredinis]|uniref:Uncharacterized protein n=1 Tax=Parascedosporium putredinis TaxID=1442378 RepID=A0A9P1H9M6_9PEZI|nr:unnamed protein product [Parascedosporium putredinis]CAI8000329.1 unnamed protein product [Parascedosporium putredinis]
MMQMQHGGPQAPASASPGSLAEVLNSPDEAVAAYESALRANPSSVPAMTAISSSCGLARNSTKPWAISKMS